MDGSADAIDTETADSRATPLKAIRLHCLWCCNGSPGEVRECVSRSCSLWLYRFGRRLTADEVAAVADVATHPSEQPLAQGALQEWTPLRAVRRRCLDCSGGSAAEVRICAFGPDHPRNPCSLHPHRMRGGSRREVLTAEGKAALRERMAALRPA